MENSIRVLIVDDHTILRQGLVRLLEFAVGITVVGQASNGQGAVTLTAELNPDVVLMDINMPVVNGIEATRQIRSAYPHIFVLALTIHDEEEYIAEMIRAGARGYILKDCEPSSVIQAIERVASGESFFPANLLERVMERFHRLVIEHSEVHSAVTICLSGLEELTRRELEVIQCIVNGMSNKEIAGSLFISEKTVKNHVTNLLRKLDVLDRTQAAVYAVQHGLAKTEN